MNIFSGLIIHFVRLIRMDKREKTVTTSPIDHRSKDGKRALVTERDVLTGFLSVHPARSLGASITPYHIIHTHGIRLICLCVPCVPADSLVFSKSSDCGLEFQLEQLHR